MTQEEFRGVRYENLTQPEADRMTVEQQRIVKLEHRVGELEEQILVCLQYIRQDAEKRLEGHQDKLLERGPVGEA